MRILDLLDEYGLDTEPLGENYRILCPFHSEDTPSCTIYPITDSFYCFGCHTGGGIVEFISLYEGISKKLVKQRLDSIEDLKSRLCRLDKKTTLDYTKETQILVSTVIYQTIQRVPYHWKRVLQIIEPFDVRLRQERFDFKAGVGLVAQLQKGLEEIK